MTDKRTAKKIQIVERPSQNKNKVTVTSPQTEQDAKQQIIEKHKRETELRKKRQTSIIQNAIIACLIILIIVIVLIKPEEKPIKQSIIYATIALPTSQLQNIAPTPLSTMVIQKAEMIPIPQITSLPTITLQYDRMLQTVEAYTGTININSVPVQPVSGGRIAPIITPIIIK